MCVAACQAPVFLGRAWTGGKRERAFPLSLRCCGAALCGATATALGQAAPRQAAPARHSPRRPGEVRDVPALLGVGPGRNGRGATPSPPKGPRLIHPPTPLTLSTKLLWTRSLPSHNTHRDLRPMATGLKSSILAGDPPREPPRPLPPPRRPATRRRTAAGVASSSESVDGGVGGAGSPPPSGGAARAASVRGRGVESPAGRVVGGAPAERAREEACMAWGAGVGAHAPEAHKNRK